MNKVVLALGAIICIMACQNENNMEEILAEQEKLPLVKTEPSQKNDPTLMINKQVKSGSTKFQVDNIRSATKKIELITSKFGGIISNMNQNNAKHYVYNKLTIRLPANRIDECLTRLLQEAKRIDYTRTSTVDVSEEYADNTTRLSTKIEIRDRYIDILRSHAKSVQDILNAEEKIRVLQEEIESIEGRMKFLDHQVEWSTIDVEIYEPAEYLASVNVNKKTFAAQVGSGLINGWRMIQSLIIGLVHVWPIVVFVGIVFVFWFRRRSIVPCCLMREEDIRPMSE